MNDDRPKSLKDRSECARRLGRLREPHIERLTSFVESLRVERGPGFIVPDFDPEDGGVNAKILFLLETPGKKAVESGFVSRNNPDDTAKNFFVLNERAGIPRSLTVSWNIVPWYVPRGEVRLNDIGAGMQYLERLLGLLPRLSVCVLIGNSAKTAAPWLRTHRPDIALVTSPHPSPTFVNRDPGNRDRILHALRAARRAAGLAAPGTVRDTRLIGTTAENLYLSLLNERGIFAHTFDTAWFDGIAFDLENRHFKVGGAPFFVQIKVRGAPGDRPNPQGHSPDTIEAIQEGAARLAISEDSLYFVVGFYTRGDLRTSTFFTIPFSLLSQFRSSGQYRFSIGRCEAAAIEDPRIVRL